MPFVSTCVTFCVLAFNNIVTSDTSTTAGPNSVFIATSDDERMRVVSTFSDCYSGRLEIFSPNKDEWSTISDCYYHFDSQDALTACETLGFTAAWTYYRGSTAYTNAGNPSVPGEPYYCGYDYVYCSSSDDNFCKDCDLDWDSYCDDRSSTCHNYDIHIYCYGGSAKTCNFYDSVNDFDDSDSKDCKGSDWSKSVKKALATLIIVAIVLSVICFILVVVGIVCCVSGTAACCACCCQKNYDHGQQQHYTQMQTSTHVVHQPVPVHMNPQQQPMHQGYVTPQVNFNPTAPTAPTAPQYQFHSVGEQYN